MDEERTEYYVEQEGDNFCVYKPDGTKVKEFSLRREALKEAARLNAEKDKPVDDEESEDQ